MMKSPLLFTAMLILGLAVLSSCSKKDETAPLITILGENPAILSLGSPPYNDPGATAADDTDGDLTASIQAENNVNTKRKGSYKITYTVSDKAGNTGEAIRKVFVVNDIEFIAGNWDVEDNKIDPQGGSNTLNYQDVITSSDTVNDVFWVTMFGGHDNGVAYIKRVVNQQCQVPQQEVICGTPSANRRFLGSATILDTNKFVVNYTEIVNGENWTGSASYERR